MSHDPSIAEPDDRIGRTVERVAQALAAVGGVALVFIVALTCVSIFGRALLSFGIGWGPVPGDFELVEIASGIAVFLFLPLCQLRRGHVTVDIFSGLMGDRGVIVTDLVGNLLMTGAAAVILRQLFLGMQDKLRYGETSFILGLPIWWGYAASLIGAFFFLLACAYTAWRSARALKAGRIGNA